MLRQLPLYPEFSMEPRGKRKHWLTGRCHLRMLQCLIFIGIIIACTIIV